MFLLETEPEYFTNIQSKIRDCLKLPKGLNLEIRADFIVFVPKNNNKRVNKFISLRRVSVATFKISYVCVFFFSKE